MLGTSDNDSVHQHKMASLDSESCGMKFLLKENREQYSLYIGHFDVQFDNLIKK